jgi:putative FmdB family regulatory protein
MPTYDYKCEKCERTFEYFQSMSDKPLSICQECNGSLKRLIGGGLGIIFKGSGFYVTDNKGKNSNTSSSQVNNSEKNVKSESAPAKKTEPKKETVKTP